jgi:hypothetical protein
MVMRMRVVGHQTPMIMLVAMESRRLEGQTSEQKTHYDSN